MKNKQWFLLLILMLSFGNNSLAEIIIKPDLIRPENPSLVAITLNFDPELKAGESAVLKIGNKEAMHASINKGTVSKISMNYVISTPVISTTTSIPVTIQRIVDKKVTEQTQVNAKPMTPVKITNTPTFKLKDSKQRVKLKNGNFRGLFTFSTESVGFDDVFILTDNDFEIEIKGSNLISKNPFIGIEGSFSNKAKISYKP